LTIEDIGADWTKGEKTYRYIARQGGMYYSKYFKAEKRHFTDSCVVEDAEKWNGIDQYDMPAFSLEQELEKRGIDDMHGMKLTQILSYMEEDAHFETLWKQGDWEIAKFFKGQLPYYWSQIRIARKHGYKIDNITEWRDYIILLRCLSKDTHNPKFVCPQDLHEAHNVVLAEYNRREAVRRERMRRENDERMRREAEEAMKRAKEEEGAFIKRREKYFDLCITTDQFKIVCLQSIEEFKNEGNTLHHCVFACGYYRKEHSLILSARDSENNPIETLEVDLLGFKIIQCRGDHDRNSPLHEDIVKAMLDNMWRVKECRDGKTMAMAS
jgi:hypothetical protein